MQFKDVHKPYFKYLYYYSFTIDLMISKKKKKNNNNKIIKK